MCERVFEPLTMEGVISLEAIASKVFLAGRQIREAPSGRTFDAT